MANSLSHRGPDGESTWSNPRNNVLLSHRRLAIIDLSDKGAQAMHYRDRYTIIYNGEIYNYIEIRKELAAKGYTFETASDTEVILASYDCYGRKCLDLFDGMFSFLIWDELEQVAFAARDRFGEKPFYYRYDSTGNILFFASEIKALAAAGIPKTVSEKRLLQYLALGYCEDPTDLASTFFDNIVQLPPAHFLAFQPLKVNLSINSYWSLDKDTTIQISENDAIDRFAELLHNSVRRRLRSDVIVGTSLSGGLDSSAITAFIQDHINASTSRKTFSCVFPGFEKDESAHIRRVCDHFQLENFSVTPTGKELIQDFDTLMYHHEEPISSASVYNQYRVYKLSANHGVKVLLDGQGADETLAGYSKYIHWYLQELISQKRFSAFNTEKGALTRNEVRFRWNWKNYAAATLPTFSMKALEQNEISAIQKNKELHPDFRRHHLNGRLTKKPPVCKLNDILFFNTARFGLGELLRYADRNAMAHGRELRLPFLSHELVEFVFSLPSHFKISQGWTKYILRKSVENKLPSATVWRKDKVGFEPPQKLWMEDTEVQDYIYESKKVLVTGKFLHASVLYKKNQPHDAYAADTKDWRYLVAGQLLK